MSDNDSSQERTEEPTHKRLTEAREKGQVPRSKELTTMVVLLTGAMTLILMGEYQSETIISLIRNSFILDKAATADPNYMLHALAKISFDALIQLLPLFFTVILATFAGSSLLGGLAVSFKAITPKLSKLNPLEGFKRMFSLKALMELVKALAKFLVVAGFASILLWLQIDPILALSKMTFSVAMVEGMKILGWSILALAATMMAIVAVDVPFQLHQHYKQLRMTRQEIKDEMKDSEGNPEVKAQIRQLQMSVARRRMMSEVPKADVVITNPEHYAVALKYNQDEGGAPVVVGRGVDFIAMQIQKVALANHVMILREAPLARSIYFSTELNEEIPVGLYMAVAQILAYVFQFKQFKKGKGKRPIRPTGFNIPDDLKR